MPVSPGDFARWAAATGKKYPRTAAERAAAAPEAFAYARNLGRADANAPGPRVGGRIIFEQPISAQNADDNSVLQSPVTPDNNIPKVAGTLDNTMTGEHYDNQQRDLVEDNRRSNDLVDRIGEFALATGLTAGGIALATNPSARAAVSNAFNTARHQTKSIGSRISAFLGNLGAEGVTDSEFVQNSGDITPPTTSQRYQQEKIPNAMQAMQAAKGANVGTPEREIVPTTTEATAVKPVTENDIITSSQTFAPRETGYRNASLANFDEAIPPSEAVQAARRQAAIERLSRASEIIRNREPYQPNIPGINTTLMDLRSKEFDVSPEAAGIYQPPTAPSKLGPTTEQMQLLTQTPDPWTGEYTPHGSLNISTTSQQTADLKPTVGQRAEQFLTVLDLGRKEKVQMPMSAIGRGTETTGGLTGSLVEEPMVMEQVSPAATEVSAPQGPVQRGRIGIPEEHRSAYKYMTAAAERGVDVSFERALEIMTDPQTVMTFEEQQAFEYAQPVALAGETFNPGERTTGQLRTLRTGEPRNISSEGLLDRYVRENLGGLTPQGRKSAGSEQLRGLSSEATAQEERLFEEGINPRSVLSTPTGRAMRNISALNPEALAEGEIEYASFVNQTTGSNPEGAAKALKAAQSRAKMEQLNSVLGPNTDAIMLELKTDKGIKPVAIKQLYRSFKPIADDIFDRGANHYAKKFGIELPNKETNYNEYLKVANDVLYVSNPEVGDAIEKMGNLFNRQLRASGINLAVNRDPELANKASHALMSIARRSTGGALSFQHFTTMAGRARAQGKIRTASSIVPIGIPAPTKEQVASAMRQAGLAATSTRDLEIPKDVLMARSAYKRDSQPEPTRVLSELQTPPPTGSVQPVIPGIMEGSPFTPRGYISNPTLDFYERSLDKEAAQLAANQPQERLVRRQGRMVPLSRVAQPYQRNMFYPNG